MRPLVLLVLFGCPLAAQRHSPVSDPEVARSLKQKFIAMTDAWARAMALTAGERAAMNAGRKWEALMMRGPDDPLARRILASGEPSFASVSSYYPGKVLDRTVLGSFNGDEEFAIWWNGAISADLFKGPLTDRLGATGVNPVAYNTSIVFRVGPEAEMYGSRGESFSRIGYEDGYLPIVTSVYQRDGIRYRQTAFADQPGEETRHDDIAYVEFEIANRGARPMETEIFEDVVLIDGMRCRAERGRVVNDSGAVLMVHSDPDAEFDGQRLRHRVRLAAGEARRIVFKIPYAPDSDGLVRTAGVADFEAAHGRMRAFWRRLIESGASIRVPEERVNRIWRALLLQNFVLADGPKLTYGSGLRYNDSTYPQESNFAAHTFAMYGHKEYADALQPYYVPISVQRGKAGRKYQNRRAMVLHHLLENWRLTGRMSAFERYRNEFYRIAEEIIADRRSTMQEVNGEKPLHWGLLPPDKPGVDVQASTQTVYVLGHNIVNCQGLQDFGTFLVRTGIDRTRGERYLREAADFRKVLVRAMERAAIRLPDRPPFVDLQTLYFRETPDYGPEPYDDLALGRLQGAYFHYWVDMVFHYNFFNPDDAAGRWLADYCRQRNGFVLGLTRARNQDRGPYGWINNVYDGGYYNFRLRAGDIGEFLLGFYARLAYGMSRHTYVASEGSPFIGYNTRHGGFAGANYSFPNSAANADTLLMLRNALAYEELKDNVETGDLWLLRGAPRAWFREGGRIEVSKLATYFGDVSFAVETGHGQVKAEIGPPRGGLRRILLSVPGGARAVTVNGRAFSDYDAKAGVVRLPTGERLSVSVQYR